MFGKMLNVVLLCLIILGVAYLYSNLVSGAVAESLNGTAELISEGPQQ